MTQAFENGQRLLTVLTVDPHTVISRSKTIEKDGYSSTVFGLGTKTKKGKT